MREGPVTPIQKQRMERKAAYAEALAAGDAEAMEAALPPWGEARRAVPHMRFRYPDNSVFPVPADNTTRLAPNVKAPKSDD